jgi:hypothetical protein
MLSARAPFFDETGVFGMALIGLSLPKIANVGRFGADTLEGAGAVSVASLRLNGNNESVGRLGTDFASG